MASASEHDVDEKIILEALERMASKQVLKGRRCRECEGGLNFEVESWCRLRTKCNWTEIPSENISQLFRDKEVLDNTIQILSKLHSSATRLQQRVASRSRDTILKLSKGITFLPNEILMLIFGFMAPPGDRNSWKQAIWLSHVSRRFRNVALGMQSIWTALDGHASVEEFETFVARSGKNTDLHLILHSSWRTDDLHDFMEMCLPLAPRWAALLVVSAVNDRGSERTDGVFEELFGCIGKEPLECPRLRLVRVEQTRFIPDEDLDEDDYYEPRWKTPNLRRIECDEYIPIPSSAYSTVKSLSVSFSLHVTTFSGRYFKDLRNLLPSMPSLETLDLTIKTSPQDLEEHHFFRIESQSVSSLTLNFPSYKAIHWEFDIFLSPFMGSIVMPNLIEFSSSFEIESQSIDDPDSTEAFLEDLIPSSFPEASEHPNLASISVKLSLTEGTKQLRWNRRLKPIEFPLICMPQVSTLSVQTPFDFTVVIPDIFKGAGSLKELRLLECNEFDATSLEKLVSSLRNANIWDKLVTFKMENCGDSLEYEDVVKIVGEEKLSFLRSGRDGLVWRLSSEESEP
ncbi:hypothetical protein SCHPADRAFT_1002404 [Schizopora paradoxa]|uniref:Uncharacterized protein n=1 Tax=Schizopora paradoxa TaxID=27342 RepID=A0A0H2RA16_9AGAM|nr:hypothetical protein SCHPADRAFT_1002404 [Schizopora paradoxa]